jgi:hypothetical protein
MIKRRELTDPASCMSRAHEDEMTFVILARDKCAPGTIKDWVKRRIKSGKNIKGDSQTTEALRCAQIMTLQRKTIFKGK